MADEIKFTKGLNVDLPDLLLAEPGFVVDEERLYIGGQNGNVPLPNQDDINIINSQLSENTQNIALKANETDATRTTTSKTVTGAINELNANKPTVESGIWTPILKGGTNAGANTYSAQYGRYVKQGKLITCFFRVVLSSKDSAMIGNIFIGGLPYAALNQNANRAGLNIYEVDYLTMPSGGIQFAGALTGGNTDILLLALKSGLISVAISPTELTNNTAILGSITYETAI